MGVASRKEQFTIALNMKIKQRLNNVFQFTCLYLHILNTFT